ncbi:peptidoglycan-binding protein [Streptomyces cadmiisoli]|uniref:Efflux RND transporter periplasmic adaptor subunit n=1 Tax=Streptomyces cadmiisoli TaxID=2184053 RepID=A0A2Z4JE47_9ACTN|nr:peptidoglycan-binding protein [Streptomyces cadmiisoli]AWW43190.1 efflux RND transporter periplasmic adaptor subunit [Streptomyces cadmiisoli]
MTEGEPDTVLLRKVSVDEAKAARPQDEPEAENLAESQAESQDESQAEPRRRKRTSGRRRAVLVAVAAGLVIATALATALVLDDTAPDRPAAREKLPPGTEPVVRGDLVTEVMATGSVRFTGARVVKNHLTGIVTWVPSANTVVEQGKRLYSVDDKPVFLLRGELPAWREFKPDMPDGEDVRMLEQNLAELGYTDFTVDEEYTEKTEAAVKRWQKNNELPANGRIELGRVVFAPGSVRIATAEVRSGDPVAPAQDVLEVTGFQHRVSAEIPSKEQDLAVKGAKAEIELPDGKRIEGTVTSVGAEKMTQDNTKVVPITVRPESARQLGSVQSADVVVVLQRLEAEDVLFVPVTALLPAEGGGYAVQLVKNGRVTVVKVKTGAFAEGRAEVSGPGIDEDARVGVPKL